MDYDPEGGAINVRFLQVTLPAVHNRAIHTRRIADTAM